jgi:hypothetical protein
LNPAASHQAPGQTGKSKKPSGLISDQPGNTPIAGVCLALGITAAFESWQWQVAPINDLLK